LREVGLTTEQLFLMQSNGGLMRIDVAASYPNETLLSGPAAGVIFWANMARLTGRQQIVTFTWAAPAPTSASSPGCLRGDARGQDHRAFSLVAFGGAGPVHASRAARNVGIPRGATGRPSSNSSTRPQ
jgi:N-methylhydantoinase A/oxoprolinase/acetone carboxylase beta subunit